MSGMKNGSELLDFTRCLSLDATNWFCIVADLGRTAHLKCVDFLAGVLECLAWASFLAIALGAKTTGGLASYVVIRLCC